MDQLICASLSHTPWYEVGILKVPTERNRHAIALPDKLGTDPVAFDGITKMTPSRKSGGIP